jgi:hypothetical protein
MLFSYTLLFAMLTTFVAAAPASSDNRGQRPDRGQNPYRQNSNRVQKTNQQKTNRQETNRQELIQQELNRQELNRQELRVNRKQTPVPDLPAPTKLLEATEYLNYNPFSRYEVGWTRLPSASKSVSRFLLFVKR